MHVYTYPNQKHSDFKIIVAKELKEGHVEKDVKSKNGWLRVVQ